GRRAALASRVADGDDVLPNAEGGGVGELDRGQPRDALDLDQRDVRAGVDAEHLRAVAAGASGNGDADAGRVLNHVVVREHLSPGRHHHAGPGGLDRPAGGLDGGVDVDDGRRDLAGDGLRVDSLGGTGRGAL